MKPKAIQRDVSSRHSRSPGGAPNLGRTSRMRAVEMTGLQYRSRSKSQKLQRDSRNPRYRKLVFIWSASLGLASLAVIGIAVYIWMAPQMGHQEGNFAATGIVPEMKVRVASRFASPSERDALNLVKRAIANRDPACVSGLFHMGSSNASEIVDYLKSSDSRDGSIESYRWLSSMDVDGLLLEGVNVAFKGIEKPVERLAFLTPDADGVWKLDFDAFARSVKPSWEALLGKSADQAVVRVIIGRDSYFNGLYRDETKWVCYGIASPDINELLRGYCKVGSPEQTLLESLLSDGVRMNRATLELRHLKESESRQFEITRILAKDWVIPDQPDRKG